MQRAISIILMGLVTAVGAWAGTAKPADDTALPPIVSCGNGIPGGINCLVSKQDEKEAKQAFARGLKLRGKKSFDQAFKQFDQAVRLDPQNPRFITAREMAESQLVFQHMQRGSELLGEDSFTNASAEFRAALELDPENQFAREQLEESTLAWAPRPPSMPTHLADAGEINLSPRDDLATFHFRGDVRALFTELGVAYGMTAQFDDSVPKRQVRFDVDNVGFFTALRLACDVSKTMWAALNSHQIFVAAGNPENHKQFDRMSLRTFMLPAHSTPQQAMEVINTMRTMFDLRFVSPGQNAGEVEVRAPRSILEACDKLMSQLSNERPQVMFDVQVFEISHQFMRTVGMHIPNTFNLYNIPTSALAALAGLGGQNIQQLINQLIASGGINQAGNTALSGLLAQLTGQQNSVFSQPLATFGGGLTFMGLSLDQLAQSLSVNESWARELEHATVRAGQGTEATFKLGERYPIMNASYAPIFNAPQIAQVIGNLSYAAPFPSISYEDLGLNIKAKPTVHRHTVSVELELQVRSLNGQSSNGIPVISNREYKGSINLEDGDPAVVAGEISRTDTLSMSGIPGLGFLPLLNQVMVTNSKEEDDDELMVIITPHILANINRTTPEIWISQN